LYAHKAFQIYLRLRGLLPSSSINHQPLRLICYKHCPQSSSYIRFPPTFISSAVLHTLSRCRQMAHPMLLVDQEISTRQAAHCQMVWLHQGTMSDHYSRALRTKGSPDMPLLLPLFKLRRSPVAYRQRSVLPKPVLKLLHVQVLFSSKAQVLLRQTGNQLQLPSKVEPNLSQVLQQRLPQSQLSSHALLKSSHILPKLSQFHLTLSHSKFVLIKPNQPKRPWRSSWMRRTEP